MHKTRVLHQELKAHKKNQGHEDNVKIVDNAQQEVAIITVGMQLKKWHPTNKIIQA